MSERLCVVMPVYNEQDAIPAVLAKWDGALSALGIDYEIRPYNDGSKDSSLAVMRKAAEGRPRISVRDKPNGGHGNTILTGYREAAADGFDWIFQVDSDDEMGPERFGELWSRRGDFDFLIGIRDGRRQALPRKVISFVSRLCVRLFYGKSVWDVNSPYRLMRTSAFRELFLSIPLSTFAPNVVISGFVGATGLRFFETRVPQHDRTTGEVSIKKWKLLKAAARSFCQTIAFSFRSVGKEDGDPYAGRRALSLCALCAVCASFAFVALTVSKGEHVWKTAVALVVVLAAMRISPTRRAASAAARWIDRHPTLCLSVVLVGGMALRVSLVSSVPDVLRLQTGDSPYFWNCAKEMAAGGFPEYKSWFAPALYALAIKVSGSSSYAVGATVNIVLQALTALVLFALGRGIFGRKVAGVVAAACYFLSPYFAFFGFKIYGEHLYFLLAALFFLLMRAWYASAVSRAPRDRDTAVCPRAMRGRILAVVIPLVAVVTLYTRGEGGLLMFALAPVLYVCSMLHGRRVFTRAMFALAVFAAVAGCGVFAGYKVNEKYHHIHCWQCSHNGWWPRLYGSVRESRGRHTIGVKFKHGERIAKICPVYKVIPARYKRDTGKTIVLLPNQCPEVLVPYIRREISRRWRKMSFRQKVRLVLDKEQHVFVPVRRMRASEYGLRQSMGRTFANKTESWKKFVLTAALLCFLAGCLKRRREHGAAVLFDLMPVLYCVGVACVVAIVEANGRYGLVWRVFLPLYAMGFVCFFRKSEKGD